VPPDDKRLPSALQMSCRGHSRALGNKLDDTAGGLDLLLSFSADVTRLDDDGDVDAALA
jgi:hypothetical protein